MVALVWLGVAACGGVTERQIGKRTGPSGGAASGGAASGGAPSAGPASGGAASAGAAAAASSGAPCLNDSDCPRFECGGEVCNWNKPHPMPVGDLSFVCQRAGLDRRGQDGWCTTTADCKCAPLGAQCVAPYCSFTRSEDAPR